MLFLQVLFPAFKWNTGTLKFLSDTPLNPSYQVPYCSNLHQNVWFSFVACPAMFVGSSGLLQFIMFRFHPASLLVTKPDLQVLFPTYSSTERDHSVPHGNLYDSGTSIRALFRRSDCRMNWVIACPLEVRTATWQRAVFLPGRCTSVKFKSENESERSNSVRRTKCFSPTLRILETPSGCPHILYFILLDWKFRVENHVDTCWYESF